MVTHPVQQEIVKNLVGLPQDILGEIADFVLFKRQKHLHPERFVQTDLYATFDAASNEQESHFLNELAEFGYGDAAE